jgi:hypothetical protein
MAEIFEARNSRKEAEARVDAVAEVVCDLGSVKLGELCRNQFKSHGFEGPTVLIVK